jgi:hypothetical protein
LRLERLLRSKFYRSVVVTDAFKTLRISQPQGDLEEIPGIQITFNEYPRPRSDRHQTTIMLPREDAFEVAREIIRVHRGPAEFAPNRRGLAADHVGLHAMSESEALMIEAVMRWKDAKMRLALWQALADTDRAAVLLEHFVHCPNGFEDLAASELGFAR